MSAHVEILGNENAPNLVLIHGWGMHSGVWQPIVKKLGTHFKLHLVDLPGMGFSRPSEPYHLHAIAESVAETLPAKADVLGWSFGGLVAMRIALAKPDLVRRLILVSSTPCFTSRDDWQHGVPGRVFEKFARDVNASYQETLMKFLTLQCMGASDARKTVKELRKSFEARPAPTSATLQKALEILDETDLRSEVEMLRKPTLIIHGDRDTLAPVQAAHWMVQNLPAGFLRVMSGAAHAPFLSHQDAFVESLTQFLEV